MPERTELVKCIYLIADKIIFEGYSAHQKQLDLHSISSTFLELDPDVSSARMKLGIISISFTFM